MDVEVFEMNGDGRRVDGGPILPGMVFRTLSGRMTTPFPKQKSDKYKHYWLIDNAINEAEYRNDEFNAIQFRSEKPITTKGKKAQKFCLPIASIEAMNMYLFEYQHDVLQNQLNNIST